MGTQQAHHLVVAVHELAHLCERRRLRICGFERPRSTRVRKRTVMRADACCEHPERECRGERRLVAPPLVLQVLPSVGAVAEMMLVYVNVLVVLPLMWADDVSPLVFEPLPLRHARRLCVVLL